MKTNKFKEFVNDYPDLVVIGGMSCIFIGLMSYAIYKGKTMGPYPEAYHFDKIDENTLEVFKLMSDGKLVSKIFTRNVG